MSVRIQPSSKDLFSFCHVCVSYLISNYLFKQTAGIAALFWDQQPNMTTQELWDKITSTASAGAVKNAMGPVDSVATTLATFTTEPATKSPLEICPLPPPPLPSAPAPPSSSSGEDDTLPLGVIIAACIVGIGIVFAVGYSCIGQIKSGQDA
jgi:hypothetical protein